MTNKHWIARRNMPLLPFGENGEGWGEIAEANLRKVDPEKSSVIFRKEYVIEQSPAEAVVKICGLGFYHLYIDGKGMRARTEQGGDVKLVVKRELAVGGLER